MSTLPLSADPDPLAVIEEEARAVVQFFGIKQCDVAAEMLVSRIANRLGGRRVYVAATRQSKAQLHARIRAQFNGRNLAELAGEHQMSERQVRRIVDSKASLKK